MLTILKHCEFSGHKGAVFALARQGDHLFSAGDDGIVARWSLSQPDLQGEAVLQVERSVYALLALPDGRLLAGMSDGTLHLWQPGQPDSLQSKRWVTTAIYNLAYNNITHEIWVLSGEGICLKIRTDEALQLVEQQQLADGNLRGLAPLPGGQMAIGTAAGDLLLLQADGQVLQQWPGHTQTAFSLAWDAAGQRLLSGGRDAMLRVWQTEADNWQKTAELPAHLYTINAIAPAPAGNLLLTASRDKTLKIWQLDELKLLKVIDFHRNYGHTHSVNQAIWINENSFISAGDDRRIIWWNIEKN